MSTTAEDCGPLLSAGATCANPSWNLYVDAFIWCCTPDDVGLALGDGECLTTALTYSNYASTVCYSSFHLEFLFNGLPMLTPSGKACPSQYCTTSKHVAWWNRSIGSFDHWWNDQRYSYG
jgi:hypothetical protein